LADTSYLKRQWEVISYCAVSVLENAVC
jgi:hypothetical protein